MKRRTIQVLLLATLMGIGITNVYADSSNNDPYESYNRFMFKINDKADNYVMQPVAQGYRKVVPSPARSAIGNVFNNLRDVVSFGSNLLRGNVKKAGYDFMRVSLNTTFGLGGLIDFAGAAGMPDNKNTLGDTFASWGWKNSHYFVYPLLGPSTVRDSVGSTIVSVYSPERMLLSNSVARYAATAVDSIDKRERLLDVTDGLDAAAVDKYAYMRDAYMAVRKQQLGLPVSQEQDESIDDLVAPDEGNTTKMESSAAASMPVAISETPLVSASAVAE